MARPPGPRHGAGQTLPWPYWPDGGVSEAYGQMPIFHQAGLSGSWTTCRAQHVERPLPVGEHNPTAGFFSTPSPDWWSSLGLDDTTEVQCGWDASQIGAGNSESTKQGNLEEEWLEAAASGRIAYPLCQNWDRKQRMLLPEVEARRSLSAMTEEAKPLVPAHLDVGAPGGEDRRVGVYDGLETVAWETYCDRSKVTAADPVCAWDCLLGSAGGEKMKMRLGKRSFFFLIHFLT